MRETGEKEDRPSSDGILLLSDRYRAWIDTGYTGHIRVIKRINFSRIIAIVYLIVERQRDTSGEPGLIRIYIPHSLRSINSENLQSFIGFAGECSNLTIEVIETEEKQAFSF